MLGTHLTLAFRYWILLHEAEYVLPLSTWKYSSLKSEALWISWEKQEEGCSDRTRSLILLLRARKIMQPFIHPKHISFHISCKNCWPLSTVIQAPRHTELIKICWKILPYSFLFTGLNPNACKLVATSLKPAVVHQPASVLNKAYCILNK